MRLLLVALLLLVSGQAWADRSFSARELDQLGRGKLVSRPMRNARANQVGGTSWILVNAHVDTVWRALTDFGSYARYLPSTERARLVERDGHVRFVAIEQGNSVIQVAYTLRTVVDPAKREVRFRVDHGRPHEVRDGWGFIHLEPREGRTLISYGVVIDPGSSLLAPLVRDTIRDHVLTVPRRIKRWVEGAGRQRYERRIAGAPTTALPGRHP
jgi:ribosome-associated toxin RatA of RatAB toxin-antitoxin module